MIREYTSRPSKATAYRKLQLLLVRLDGIFISAYQIKNKLSENGCQTNLSLNEFFESKFLNALTDNFDLTQDSQCIEYPSGQYIPCIQRFPQQWQEVDVYAKDLLQSPYVLANDSLAYELNYLITENAMAQVFKLCENIGPKKFNVNFQSCLATNQINEPYCKNAIDNIIYLHHFAFKLFKKLKKVSRFESSVYSPPFYPK